MFATLWTTCSFLARSTHPADNSVRAIAVKLMVSRDITAFSLQENATKENETTLERFVFSQVVGPIAGSELGQDFISMRCGSRPKLGLEFGLAALKVEGAKSSPSEFRS